MSFQLYDKTISYTKRLPCTKTYIEFCAVLHCALHLGYGLYSIEIKKTKMAM